MSARVCCVAKIKQSRRTLNKLESATVQVGSGIDGRHISQRVGIQEDRPSFCYRTKSC